MTATPSTVIQTAPFLRSQRQFPYSDVKDLSRQVDQAYIDIASKVNQRVIGQYAVGFSSITGEQWYLSGSSGTQPLQTLRQVYAFTADVSGTTSIPHRINTANITGFSHIYGTATDGTNWYPLPYVVAAGGVVGQISVVVTPTNIVITEGAASPNITTGWIVLEWISEM